ncbi:hypothetical protein [Paenibacillus chitinolyticus]
MVIMIRERKPEPVSYLEETIGRCIPAETPFQIHLRSIAEIKKSTAKTTESRKNPPAMLTGFSYVRFTACSGYVSICFFLVPWLLWRKETHCRFYRKCR